jgi:hypothetical protein
MIRLAQVLLATLALYVSTTSTAMSQASCPWKLVAYGDNMDLVERGIEGLSGQVSDANNAIKAARADVLALLTSDCNAETKKAADALADQISQAAAAHAKLAETADNFAACDRFMSDKVKRESEAAVAAGDSTKVLKLSGIEKAIRNLTARGLIVDHEMIFLGSKLDRLEIERAELYSSCLEGGGNGNF